MARSQGKDSRPASQRVGLKAYKHPDRFGELLGYESLKVDRKKNRGLARLKIREQHLSPANRVHGGVISACFDVALGLAVFSTMEQWEVCSTVELKVNYLKPIHLGDVLIFKSEVDFRGKRLCVVHSYAYKNGEKTPTAMASGTYYVITTHAT
ncbi:MAG TPA: PaaI family thioesterase [Bdellovibrionota bacterium]|nr:PaaI family thioesterase [Bdellovibrionota bacterium]